VHPFRVKLAAGQAQKFGEKELISLIKQLADADYRMKTGAMNKELLIELILLKLNQK
jgi:DNA polymerase III subunit delta